MSRARFNFRPSGQIESHRKAWAYLQTVPDGQRNDFLVRAILRMQEDTVLEETLRRILREELQAIRFQTDPSPEDAEQNIVSESGTVPPIPQEMLSFLGDLMQDG